LLQSETTTLTLGSEIKRCINTSSKTQTFLKVVLFVECYLITWRFGADKKENKFGKQEALFYLANVTSRRLA
jgi:hypothetical protein